MVGAIDRGSGAGGAPPLVAIRALLTSILKADFERLAVFPAQPSPRAACEVANFQLLDGNDDDATGIAFEAVK